MEETLLYGRGWRELTSSELQIRGGTDKNIFVKVFEKIRNLIDTIMDYLPSLINGFKDGFIGNKKES